LRLNGPKIAEGFFNSLIRLPAIQDHWETEADARSVNPAAKLRIYPIAI